MADNADNYTTLFAQWHGDKCFMPRNQSLLQVLVNFDGRNFDIRMKYNALKELCMCEKMYITAAAGKRRQCGM